MPHKDPEKSREYKRRWREANRDKVNAQTRKLRLANPERQRAHGRKWYAANQEKKRDDIRAAREAAPEKYAARQAVKNAIRRGTLHQPSVIKCDACPKSAAHYHHDSYAEEHWLKVRPLCALCHATWHRENKIS